MNDRRKRKAYIRRMSWLARWKSFSSRFLFRMEFCHRCGRDQPIAWKAPDADWERFSRGFCVLCPMCYDELSGTMIDWTPTVRKMRALPHLRPPTREVHGGGKPRGRIHAVRSVRRAAE